MIMPRTLPGMPDKWNEKTSPKVRVISYGDGYEQIAKDGLNNQLRKWRVSMGQQRGDVIELVRDFLNSTYGVEAFYCTPPGATAPVLVRVDGDYDRDYEHQNAVVSFTFGLREVVV